MPKRIWIILLVMLALAPRLEAALMTNLSVEYRQNPRGVDVAQPQLSWNIVSDVRGEGQSAYWVLVASTPELRAKDQGDLWNTGQVKSDQSNQNFDSQNHFMLGQINEWFFHDLAGIQPDPTGPGFKKIVIKPALAGDINWVKVTYGSIRGNIVSNWTNNPNGLTMNITIPVGSTATVYVPTTDPKQVKESGKPASSSPGIKYLRTENSAAVYEVVSGSYTFSSTYVARKIAEVRNSLFTDANSSAFPQGAQAAFLQETGSMSQTLDDLIPGAVYKLTFSAAQRPGGNKEAKAS